MTYKENFVDENPYLVYTENSDTAYDGNGGSSEIPDGAVTTAKIADDAVTADKIADGVIPLPLIVKTSTKLNMFHATDATPFAVDKTYNEILQALIDGKEVFLEIPVTLNPNDPYNSESVIKVPVLSKSLGNTPETSACIFGITLTSVVANLFEITSNVIKMDLTGAVPNKSWKLTNESGSASLL